MSKISMDHYLHLGMVVHDLDKALAQLQEFVSIDKMAIRDFPPKDVSEDEIALYYRGKKGDFTAKFCFIEAGPTEIEIIQPLTGESVWNEFLENHPDGVHHVKFEVESINETLRDYKAKGVDCLQFGSGVGPNSGKTWAYFDTEKVLGYTLEVLNKQVGEKVDLSLL